MCTGILPDQPGTGSNKKARTRGACTGQSRVEKIDRVLMANDRVVRTSQSGGGGFRCSFMYQQLETIAMYIQNFDAGVERKVFA